MKRREFFQKAGIASAALASLPVLGHGATPAAIPIGAAPPAADDEHGHGHQDDMNGALSSATVSFGQWNVDAPLDRFANQSPRNRNNHQLIPAEAKIKAGGSINFDISGFHLVTIYDDGVQPSDIDRTKLTSVTVPPGPPLINDPKNRIYRGLDPSVMPMLPGNPLLPNVGPPPPPNVPPQFPQPLQDRVEVVRFPNPGRYLVICGVLPHFFDAATGQFLMFGYVRVLRNDD